MSKGKEPAKGGAEDEVAHLPSYLVGPLAVLHREVPPLEDNRRSNTPISSLAEEASRQLASVFKIQELVEIELQAADVSLSRLKDVEKELEGAKKCTSELKYILPRNEGELQEKSEELKNRGCAHQDLEAQLRKALDEVKFEQDRVKLEQDKVVAISSAYQSLVSQADGQFDAGVDAAIKEARVCFPDMDLSVLEKSLGLVPASPQDLPAPSDPVPGSQPPVHAAPTSGGLVPENPEVPASGQSP